MCRLDTMSSPCKPLDLYWRVGKFIYPRGGSVLLHHMPLQQFHLEEGLNVSAIMSLRLSRQSSGAVNLGSLELSRWLDLTQAEAIAKLCMVICPKKNSVSLTEIDPGLGLVFEAIKVQLHSNRPDTKLEYSLVGGERWRRKFSMLHADDDTKFQHVSSRDQAGTDVVILNHTNGVRESAGPSCTPLEFAAALSGSGVMAARVVDGDHDQRLTTIAGTEISCPHCPACCRHVLLRAVGDTAISGVTTAAIFSPADRRRVSCWPTAAIQPHTFRVSCRSGLSWTPEIMRL